ncbi:hypothetical protein LguiA_006615 [Lonicera macranthoides]
MAVSAKQQVQGVRSFLLCPSFDKCCIITTPSPYIDMHVASKLPLTASFPRGSISLILASHRCRLSSVSALYSPMSLLQSPVSLSHQVWLENWAFDETQD